MNVELINYNSVDPDELCGTAAMMCYNGSDPQKSLKHSIKLRHDSVTEHSSFTFMITGISSVLLSQLTRHRFFSFSVQSERYCGANYSCVVPPSVADNPDAKKLWDDTISIIHDTYKKLVSEFRIPKEDARMIREKATTYNLIATANARELNRFFELRCCTRAQWEIRELANKMLALVKVVAPITFSNAGPHCERYGFCPEGDKCCGRAMTYEDAKWVYYLLKCYVNKDEVALLSKLDKMSNKHIKRGVLNNG